jgi:formate hydrogenlyase transcriptional activator
MDSGVAKSEAKEIDERQREEIERVLGETKGRVGGAEGAAARLGMKRTTLLARMKKLGIDPKLFS